MPLASLTFVLFLAGVGVASFLTTPRWRWLPLLLASYAFYALLTLRYTLLLGAITVFSYFAAIAIAKREARPSRVLFWSAVLVVLAPLLVLKYAAFAAQLLALVPGGVVDGSPHFRFVLPIGISFFTIQVIGYLIDVSQGTTPAERHFGRYATFVAFFPHITAGPVGRSDLLEQIATPGGFDYERVTSGIKLAAWGMFKKLVVADRLGVAVDHVYASPENYSGVAVAFIAWLYLFQVYADFSGYSDIAVGSARVLGVELTQNFSRPYLSRSVGEYWRRWHISFSTWLNEYIYLPLSAMFRKWAKPGAVLALLLTFLISGLWHGAALTFVVFGMMHGLVLVVEMLTSKARARAERRFPVPVRATTWMVTITFLCAVDVLFRAPTLDMAWRVYRRIAVGLAEDARFVAAQHGSLGALKSLLVGIGFTSEDLIWVAVFIVVMVGCDVLAERKPMSERIRSWPTWARWSVYYGTTAAILFLSPFSRSTTFVYYQF